MADVKISELTALTSPDGAEELVVNDSGTTKKITITNATSASLPKAGGTMTGDTGHADNVKAKFGAGDDLQIYHDGGHSRIKDVGTGNLVLAASTSVNIDGANGTNIAHFYESGVSRFYGNVGIGTASPNRQLNVENTLANSGGVIGLTSSDSSTTGSLGIIHFGNSTDTSLASINGIADGSTSSGALLFKTEAAGGAIDERMRIDSSGNVGIGVTPEAWAGFGGVLQIGGRGSVAAGSDTEYSNNSYYNSGYKYIDTALASSYAQAQGKHIFKVAPSGTADAAISWTTAMTIDNGGNLFLGSGTSSTPWADTSGAGTFRFQKDNGTNNASMQFSSDGEKTGYAMIYLNLINGSNDENIQSFYRNSNNVGSIKLNGTTGVSYETTSDYRVKENVVPMTDSTNRLKALKPSRFNFISEPLVTIDGFLAHEAGEVVPECISGTKDAMMDEEYEVTPAVLDDEGVETTAAVMGTRSVPDMQGIDQAKLVPLLTATIQELIARIEALEA